MSIGNLSAGTRRTMVGLVAFSLLTGGWVVAQQPGQGENVPAANDLQLATPQAKASYGIGLQIGRDFARGGLDEQLLDLNAMLMGIQDALSRKSSRVSDTEFREAMTAVQQAAQQRMQQKMQASAEKNLREGPAFLAKYKGLEGVQSTASGLLYRVLKQGAGPSPAAQDTVRVHYRGRLVDGTQFDSSYDRGQPAVFPVSGVIAGWTEALQKMKVGDRWQLVIPAELAYGKQGNPPVIGPDAVLVFDVELLGIEPKQPQQQGVPQTQ